MIGFEGAPRFVSLIQALTGDEDICPPGLLLEVDRPEYSALKREQLWSGSFAFGALAANFNQLAIGTAGGLRGYIHVLTHLQVSSDCFIGIANIAGTAGNRGLVCRDSGFAGGLVPAFASMFQKQAVGQIFGVLQPFKLNAATPYGPGNLPVHISRDTGTIVIESTLVNVALTVWLAGYSRQLRPEETVP